MSDTSDPSTSSTVIIGVVGAIVVFALIVALQALYYHVEEAQTQAKTAGYTPEALARLRAEQTERLRSFGWADQSKGTVHIPIDRAMELTVRELGASATRPATRNAVGS